MLADVQADLFALAADRHWNHFVDELVERHAHDESVGKDDSDGCDVEQKDREALGSAADKTLLNEDAGEEGADDAACAVGGEDVKCVVQAV